MEKVWTVYMLECGDGTLYTGITDDFLRRFKAHAEGRGAKYTRGRGPLKLRYLETAADKSAALKLECTLKRLRKSQKMAIISEKEMENDLSKKLNQELISEQEMINSAESQAGMNG